jgi:hypothetical protein
MNGYTGAALGECGGVIDNRTSSFANRVTVFASVYAIFYPTGSVSR